MTDVTGADLGVSEDGMRTRVAINATLDAAELEELIDRLAACRAAMTPTRLPVMFPGTPIKLGRGMHVQEGEDDGTLIAVYHPGFGWVGAIQRHDI